MSVEMVMPKMGESITEGTILKWLKAEGDAVGETKLFWRSLQTKSIPRSPHLLQVS